MAVLETGPQEIKRSGLTMVASIKQDVIQTSSAGVDVGTRTDSRIPIADTGVRRHSVSGSFRGGLKPIKPRRRWVLLTRRGLRDRHELLGDSWAKDEMTSSCRCWLSCHHRNWGLTASASRSRGSHVPWRSIHVSVLRCESARAPPPPPPPPMARSEPDCLPTPVSGLEPCCQVLWPGLSCWGCLDYVSFEADVTRPTPTPLHSFSLLLQSLAAFTRSPWAYALSQPPLVTSSTPLTLSLPYWNSRGRAAECQSTHNSRARGWSV